MYKFSFSIFLASGTAICGYALLLNATEGKVRSDIIRAPAVLPENHCFRSENGAFIACMQNDGNFVVYGGVPSTFSVIWDSGTAGKGHGFYNLAVQDDNNLVIYTGTDHQAIWNTGTTGQGSKPTYLSMQNDANLVLYDAESHPLWFSGSTGRCGVQALSSPAAFVEKVHLMHHCLIYRIFPYRSYKHVNFAIIVFTEFKKEPIVFDKDGQLLPPGRLGSYLYYTSSNFPLLWMSKKKFKARYWTCPYVSHANGVDPLPFAFPEDWYTEYSDCNMYQITVPIASVAMVDITLLVIQQGHELTKLTIYDGDSVSGKVITQISNSISGAAQFFSQSTKMLIRVQLEGPPIKFNGVLKPYSLQCGDYFSFDPIGLCLRYGQHGSSFAEAQHQCLDWDASLISIHSRSAATFTTEFSTDARRLAEGKKEETWIGLHIIDEARSPQWIDHSPVNYIDWTTGSPTNESERKCGALKTGITPNQWTLLSCDTELPFICAKDPKCPMVTTRAETGTIQSANYPQPSPRGVVCVHRIVVAEDQKVYLKFGNVTLGKNDFILVLDGASDADSMVIANVTTRDRSCRRLSAKNALTVIYRSAEDSDKTVSFVARYISKERSTPALCPHHNSSEAKGLIHSPNFPYYYQSSTICLYQITVGESERIRLTFKTFNTTASYDYLILYDGPTELSQEFARLSGSEMKKKTFETTGRYLTAKFVTGTSGTRTGFSAEYEAFKNLFL